MKSQNINYLARAYHDLINILKPTIGTCRIIGLSKNMYRFIKELKTDTNNETIFKDEFSSMGLELYKGNAEQHCYLLEDDLTVYALYELVTVYNTIAPTLHNSDAQRAYECMDCIIYLTQDYYPKTCAIVRKMFNQFNKKDDK